MREVVLDGVIPTLATHLTLAGFAVAAFLVVFALVVSVMPHRVTEWPYVVFVVAFAILFAKPSVRKAFLGKMHTLPLGRVRTPSVPQKGQMI